MQSEQTHGFVQPLAAIAFAIVGMRSFFGVRRAHEFDRSFERFQQLIERRVGRRGNAVRIQPTAGGTEATGGTLRVVHVEVAAKVTMGEIDFALDHPARIVEQRNDVARNRTRVPARECCHRQPRLQSTSLFPGPFQPQFAFLPSSGI